MKIIIEDTCSVTEPEVVIRCQKADEKILKMISVLRACDDKITGIKDGQIFILNISDVFYIESVDRKTFLYADQQVYETPLKLYELEERLGENDFIRITKSSILNFAKIKSIRADLGGRLACKLSNDEMIHVSRQYAVTIKQKLEKLKG